MRAAPSNYSNRNIDRLSNDIRAAREIHGVELEVAARAIGVSPSALRRLESGKSRNCAGETVFKVLAWAHNLGYREFCGFRISAAPAGQGGPHQPCFICRSEQWCAHREPAVEAAELDSLSRKPMGRAREISRTADEAKPETRRRTG